VSYTQFFKKKLPKSFPDERLYSVKMHETLEVDSMESNEQHSGVGTSMEIQGKIRGPRQNQLPNFLQAIHPNLWAE